MANNDVSVEDELRKALHSIASGLYNDGQQSVLVKGTFIPLPLEARFKPIYELFKRNEHEAELRGRITSLENVNGGYYETDDDKGMEIIDKLAELHDEWHNLVGNTVPHLTAPTTDDTATDGGELST